MLVSGRGVTWQGALRVAVLPPRRCPADDGRARNVGGSMTGSAVPRRTHRRGFVAVASCSSSSRSSPRWHPSRAPRQGPSVPAAGVGTKAALNSPECDKSDGRLAYPYQHRAPCTRAAEEGREQRRRDQPGRHEGHHQDRLARRHARSAGHGARTMPGGSAPVEPRDEPTGVHRGLVPRLAGRCSTTASTCGAASSSS